MSTLDIRSNLVGATYARISTAQQKDGISLDQQNAHMVTYAVHNNITVPDAYRFLEQESGYKSERSDYNKIRELVREHIINVLIVYGSDRYTRDPIHGEIFRSELRRHKVALHIILEGGEVDIISATGQFMRRQMDNFNWYWGKMIQQTIQDKKQAYIEQGIPLMQGRAPFGYVRVGKRDKGRLEVVEEEAAIIQRIFTLFDQGHGAAAIADMLAGIPTPSDRRGSTRQRKSAHGTWSVGVIYQYLRDEVYAGTYHAFKRRVIEGELGQRVELPQPRSEWQPASVPAIVDRELWERAQQRLDSGYNNIPRQHGKYEYLIARRTKCRVCGYSISGNTVFHKRVDGSRYEKIYYRCNTWQKAVMQERCSLPYVPCRAVDATVWKFVHALLSNPKALASSVRDAQQSMVDKNQELIQRLADLDGLIAERTHDMEEIARSFPSAQGMLRTMLQQQANQLEETISGVQMEREKLRSELSEYIVSEEDIEALETFAEQVKDQIDTADFATKRAMIEQLHLTFELAKEGAEFVVYVTWMLREFRLTVMQNSASH